MPTPQQPACWTCRLRRKKCDRALPLCAECKKYDITCFAGDKPRPDWMDGGTMQEHETFRIREYIRSGQAQRKINASVWRTVERKMKRQQEAGRPEQDAREAYFARQALLKTMEKDGPRKFGEYMQNRTAQLLGEMEEPLSQDTQGQLSDLRVEMEREQGLRPLPQGSVSVHGSSRSPTPVDKHTEAYISVDFTVMYLDYVFPFLFPHYRPTIFEGGRAWVLATLQTEKPLYHTAMSLTAYFMALLTQTKETSTTTTQAISSALQPANLSPDAFSATSAKLCAPDETLKTVCGHYIWDILSSHMGNAVRAVRQDIHNINSRSDPRLDDPENRNRTILEHTRLVGNVVHLQIFDVAMGPPGGSGTRQCHLTAATNEIMRLWHDHRSLDKILDAMSRDVSDSLRGPGWRIWNTDQAAFRFSLSVLLYMDIVESTTTMTRPRLKELHKDLIAQSDADDDGKLRVEEFVGCQGWVLVIIADIANLCDKDKSLPFSQWEVAAQAESLLRRIHGGLSRLQSSTASSISPVNSTSQMPTYLQAYYRPDASSQKDEQTLITRIWGLAALVYLESVSRQCACDECASDLARNGVRTVLQLIQQMSSPAILRGLIWPLVVVGNMATVEQQATIRTIVSKAGPLVKFGGLAAMLQHLEELWTCGRPKHGDPVVALFSQGTSWQETPIYM